MAHITKEQRYTIEVLLAKGKTQKFIPQTINKDKSVISRELSRNKDKRNRKYSSGLAQRKYRRIHVLNATIYNVNNSFLQI